MQIKILVADHVKRNIENYFIYLFIYLFIHLFTYLLPAYVSHYWTDKILTNTYICIIPDA